MDLLKWGSFGALGDPQEEHKKGSGFELWRRFARRHIQFGAEHAEGLLNQMQSLQPCKDHASLYTCVDALRIGIHKYEDLIASEGHGEKFGPGQQRALLLRVLPDDVSKHISGLAKNNGF